MRTDFFTADDWITAAGQAGEHALAVFGLLLATALALAAAGAWAMRAHGLPHARRARQGLSRPAWLMVSAVAGMAVVLGAAALFAEIAGHLGPGRVMARADEALALALRTHLDDPTLRAFALVTHLGDALTLTLLGIAVAALLWRRRERALTAAWVLALGGNALLNPLLKQIFERVRPLHEPGLVTELSWSFPSGHTSGATVAYGMLAYVALRTLPARWHLGALLGATALVVTVGCSRILLQVHWASDVAAGFASGAAWLVVCIASIEFAQQYRRRA